MTTLLIGASGQLGTALLAELNRLGTVVPAARPAAASTRHGWLGVDLSLPDTLRAAVREVRPRVIVNAAAYTAVDAAETDAIAAHAANAIAPAVLAEEAARAGASLVHYSTDYVFSGEGGRPWREQDPVAPLNQYGRTKAAGEAAIRASGAQHLILRTSWLYGAAGRNFVKTMLTLAARRDELSVVADQTGSPTSVDFVAAVSRELLARAAADSTWFESSGGTLHVACGGQTTWHGLATAIFTQAAQLRLPLNCPRVRAIPSSEFPTAARRPSYSRLEVSKLVNTFGIQPPDWSRELGRVLGAIYAQHIAEQGAAEQGAINRPS